MSKNKKSRFPNRASRRFADINKVDLIPEDEIYRILDDDMETILAQFTAHRNHEQNASYPTYMANAFANLSTSKFFYEYVQCHVQVKKKGRVLKTDLTKDEIESLRHIIADAYTKSAMGFYERAVQEYAMRAEYLSKAFVILYPGVYKLSKKLEGLSKSQRRDLTIRIYGEPVYNMKFIHRTFNEVTIADRKKLKILQAMYGDRFVEAVGAAMTVEGNTSDCLAMLYDFMMDRPKKKRKAYIRAYAEAYKRAKGSRYFRLYDPLFRKKNKKIIKKLIQKDIGYWKAFDGLDRAPVNKGKPKDPAGSKPVNRKPR